MPLVGTAAKPSINESWLEVTMFDGGRPVTVRLSRQTLLACADYVGRASETPPSVFERLFEEYRRDIEAAARRKFEQRRLAGGGDVVWITRDDL